MQKPPSNIILNVVSFIYLVAFLFSIFLAFGAIITQGFSGNFEQGVIFCVSLLVLVLACFIFLRRAVKKKRLGIPVSRYFWPSFIFIHILFIVINIKSIVNFFDQQLENYHYLKMDCTTAINAWEEARCYAGKTGMILPDASASQYYTNPETYFSNCDKLVNPSYKFYCEYKLKTSVSNLNMGISVEDRINKCVLDQNNLAGILKHPEQSTSLADVEDFLAMYRQFSSLGINVNEKNNGFYNVLSNKEVFSIQCARDVLNNYVRYVAQHEGWGLDNSWYPAGKLYDNIRDWRHKQNEQLPDFQMAFKEELSDKMVFCSQQGTLKDSCFWFLADALGHDPRLPDFCSYITDTKIAHECNTQKDAGVVSTASMKNRQ